MKSRTHGCGQLYFYNAAEGGMAIHIYRTDAVIIGVVDNGRQVGKTIIAGAAEHRVGTPGCPPA